MIAYDIYWGINYKCLVFRSVLRYIVHVLHRFFVSVTFSTPEAALLLVSTKDRDLWPGPTTFRF